jgi:hypothetical protein
MKSKSSKKYRINSVNASGGKTVVSTKHKNSRKLVHRVVKANSKGVMEELYPISLHTSSHKTLVVSSSEIESHSRTIFDRAESIKSSLSKIK